ncbi:hypothetical protein HWD94_03815 [Pseudarthrobacter equi]|uniref:hypothetical protein n=1 Tax=Pseudarthrobacter equi TaxID=728066 RepID=UPI0021BF717E|nr:hypothetical protein [Pseudarthrobacter equi]MCT9624250.1 hypothetical protein [Pseudarthrobacter equi]
MGFIIFAIVVVVLMFGVGGWIAIGLIISEDRSKKKAEANAPDILDKSFIGDDVVFKINAASPKYETVVLGAKARGYRLTSQTDDTSTGSAKTLIFEKVPAAEPDAR